jgi:hypothetical protein
MPITSIPVDTLPPASNDSRRQEIIFATAERTALKQRFVFVDWLALFDRVAGECPRLRRGYAARLIMQLVLY